MPEPASTWLRLANVDGLVVALWSAVPEPDSAASELLATRVRTDPAAILDRAPWPVATMDGEVHDLEAVSSPGTPVDRAAELAP